jgi:tetratricopeptide (TPR) repeat protein
MMALHGLRGHVVLTALAMVALRASAFGDDSVTTRDGTTYRGSLVSVAPDGIDIEERGVIRKVSIVDLVDLAVDGEPEPLRDARRFLQRRDSAAAIEELTKVSVDDLKALDPRVREEYDFVRIASNALNADAKTIDSWEQQLLQFLQKNARSHRFYEGSEILGDVRARMGKFAEAAEAYGNLDRGPPALQIRSASARASLLMRQGKFPEAIKEFQAAEKISTSDDDAASVRQKLEASLGRARCLSQSGKAAEGAAVAKDVIVATQPDEKDLLADAYTVLGTCERAAGGRDQDAIVAFLTVDLVYSGVPSAHAEALYNLVSLWDASNQPERSRQAAQVLMTSYPTSPWAAKLPGAGKSS